jgi:hypothetical protein
MRLATATRRARVLALLAVVGLHLLGGLLIITSALREPRLTEPSSPVAVWLAWSSQANAAQGRPRRSTAANSRAGYEGPARSESAPGRARRAPSPRNTSPPATSTAATPNVDWNSELSAAAAASIEHASRERRRNSSMGATPNSPYAATPTRPEFPWSHQPLGKHYDFDSATGIFMLRSQRCVLAFWLILPGFACSLGHADPEPGEGDLFDRKYAAGELRLPKSLRDAQLAPP